MEPIRGRRSAAGPDALRAAALTAVPALLRGLTTPTAQRRIGSLATSLRRHRIEGLPALLGDGGRHPLSPAAVRVERSRGRDGEQTAVTVWFQEGPSLPMPLLGGRERSNGRPLLRLGAGVLGAAALAAATGVAGRLQSGPPRLRVVPSTAEPVGD